MIDAESTKDFGGQKIWQGLKNLYGRLHREQAFELETLKDFGASLKLPIDKAAKFDAEESKKEAINVLTLKVEGEDSDQGFKLFNALAWYFGAIESIIDALYGSYVQLVWNLLMASVFACASAPPNTSLAHGTRCCLSQRTRMEN